MKTLFFLTVTLFFATLHLSAQNKFNGKVTAVLDGSTLQIIDNDGDPRQIKLKSIDCPHIDQAYGIAAKDWTAKLVLNKILEIELFGKDRFGNSFATIVLEDGSMLNYNLIKSGMAWYCERNKADSELAGIEKDIKAKKIGLWANADAMAPWIFRRQQTMLVAKLSY